MELRMSLHPGLFLKFVIRWSENIGPLHALLSKKELDPRMNDVELAVRYLAFRDDKFVYKGDLKKFLDQACIELNSEFQDRPEFEEIIEDELQNMLDAIDAGIEIFGRKSFCRKFIDGNFENRFNRAVFDV